MDHIAFRKTDSSVDLESGEGTTSEEDAGKDFVWSAEHSKTLLGKVRSAEYGAVPCSNDLNFSGDKFPMENVRVLRDENLEELETTLFVEKKTAGEKCKKKSAKMASKPPRPPRGPSLDAADQKLIREINELALLKRARIERVKALKKMKATESSSSSNSNFLAMLFTILFFLIIFFQV